MLRISLFLVVNLLIVLAVISPPWLRSSAKVGRGSVETFLGRLGFVFLPETTPVTSKQLIISEVQPANAGELLDDDGHCPDWIELWNASAEPLEVTGWYLTDDPHELDKWEFPALVVSAGERIVVFASGKDSDDIDELHTNFKLAQEGDYLALVFADGQTVLQELFVGMPAGAHGQSFDTTTSEPRPLVAPTPGEMNSEISQGTVKPVTLSHESCLFEEPFALTMQCAEAGASIRYTTDGSLPTESTGHRYQGPLAIDRTTVVRALAFAPRRRPSQVVTRSYLQLQHLVQQTDRPDGFPEHWDDTEADYEMDPKITTRYENQVKAALQSLPIVSVVAEQDELFGRDGIYSHTFNRGFDWEIPAEVEMLRHDGTLGFESRCGIRICGNECRSENWKKHSLRLNFRKRYGEATLAFPLFSQPGHSRFSALLLRSTDDSWLSHHPSVRNNAQYIRDQWSRDTEIAMGRLSARGRYVHVCLNGLYWGVYNLMERPDDEFLANQLGGDSEDYITFRTRVGELEADADGERVWNEIIHRAQSDLRQQRNFAGLSKRLDVIDLIDYCLVNLYAGGEDWALVNGNNLRAYCEAKKNSRLRFLAWDNDSGFASGWNNHSVDYVLRTKRSGDASSFQALFDRLSRSHKFRQLMVERLHHWSSEGQALHTAEARRRYEALANTVEPALVAEAARWGDVHAEGRERRLDSWAEQKQRILDHWFVGRSEKVLRALKRYWKE